MKARIRNFWIRDRFFEYYFPENLEYFGAFVDMRIGPDDEGEGADDFELMVCSPSWFEQNILKPPKKSRPKTMKVMSRWSVMPLEGIIYFLSLTTRKKFEQLFSI